MTGLVEGEDALSFSVTIRRFCRPVSTRSIAVSKSACAMCCWLRRAATIAASFAMFARSAPVSPAVRRASNPRSTSAASGFERVDAEDRLATRQVGRADVHLSVEAPRAEQRRVEVLQSVRGAHHHDVLIAGEAVELDEELVQSLVVPWFRPWPWRAIPTASSLSMKTIAGAFFRASKSLRMRAAPRPANIPTNADALDE